MPRPQPAPPPAAAPWAAYPAPQTAPGPAFGAAAGWYLSNDGSAKHGPYAEDQIRQFVAEKGVTRQTLVWRDGWPKWGLLKDTPEFGGAFPSSGLSRRQSTSSQRIRRYRRSPVQFAVMAGFLLAALLGGGALLFMLLPSRPEKDQPAPGSPELGSPKPPAPEPAREETPGQAPAAGAEEAAKVVFEGSRHVLATFEGICQSMRPDDTAEAIFRRILAGVSREETYVLFPAYERERLMADFDRIRNALDVPGRTHDTIDLLLVVRTAFAAEKGIRGHFLEKASIDSAWSSARVEMEDLLDRENLSREAFAACLSGTSNQAESSRTYFAYFAFRLALIHRTRGFLQGLGIQEGGLADALGGAREPQRTHIPLPEIAGAEEPPDAPGPEGPGPKLPAREEEPEYLLIEAIQGLLGDREVGEAAEFARSLAGRSLIGEATFLSYKPEEGEERKSIHLLASSASDRWTVYVVGPAMVPADGELADTLEMGAKVQCAAQILGASLAASDGEGGILTLKVRFVKFVRAD
ncbi:MAG: DUF4339 domain-containing protein [Planctomycetes bacterium]|nr:DUF4339 domain-containing protein [Planctomycetota bacterium]